MLDLVDLRVYLSTILKMETDNALLVAGMVCSSWVALSRASTRRHYFCPLGDGSSLKAEEGNQLVSRCLG